MFNNELAAARDYQAASRAALAARLQSSRILDIFEGAAGINAQMVARGLLEGRN